MTDQNYRKTHPKNSRFEKNHGISHERGVLSLKPRDLCDSVPLHVCYHVCSQTSRHIRDDLLLVEGDPGILLVEGEPVGMFNTEALYSTGVGGGVRIQYLANTKL